MITGYNTDVRHVETVVHVQTEDKGRGNPFIESVVYVAGRVVATKRSSYAELLHGGQGRPRDRRADGPSAPHDRGGDPGRPLRRQAAGTQGPGGSAPRQPRPERRGRPRATTARHGAAEPSRETHADDALAELRRAAPVPATTFAPPQASAAGSPIPGVPDCRPRRTDEGPTLDQVILDYLSTEAEHEQLVLAIDGQEEIQPGRSTTSRCAPTRRRAACRSPACRCR